MEAAAASLEGRRRTPSAKMPGVFGVVAFSLLMQVMGSRVWVV